MANKLKASVGKKGKNTPEDVKTVEELLNAFAATLGFAKLPGKGQPSAKLNEAIGKVQLEVCGFKPDFTVDPGKTTYKALVAGPAKFKAQQRTQAKTDEKAAKDAAEKAKAKVLAEAKKKAERAAKPAAKTADTGGGFWDFLDEVADTVEKAAEEVIDKAIETAKKTGKSIEEEVEKLMARVSKDAQKEAEEAARKAAEAAKKAAEEAAKKAEEEKKKNEPDPNRKGTVKWRAGVDKNVSAKLTDVIAVVAGHFDTPILVVGGRRDKNGQISAMWKGWDKHLKNGTIYPALRARPALREELDGYKASDDFAAFKKAMLDKCPWSQISRHLSGEAVDISTATDAKILKALKDCLYYLPETSKDEVGDDGKPAVKCHHFSLKRYTKPTVEMMKKWKK